MLEIGKYLLVNNLNMDMEKLSFLEQKAKAVKNTKEIGLKTKCMVMEDIVLPLAQFTPVTGSKERWKEKEK